MTPVSRGCAKEIQANSRETVCAHAKSREISVFEKGAHPKVASGDAFKAKPKGGYEDLPANRFLRTSADLRENQPKTVADGSQHQTRANSQNASFYSLKNQLENLNIGALISGSNYVIQDRILGVFG